ncbi:MAG: hypothetical protein AMXMBFR13_22390 [Phycisphaerae bacterium]
MRYRLIIDIDARRMVAPIEQLLRAVLKLSGRTFGARVISSDIEIVENAPQAGTVPPR